MKFAVLGGDERTLALCRLLRARGHAVTPCFLGARERCVPLPLAPEGADCVILPVPCTRAGALNAPFEAERVPVADLLRGLPEKTRVLAGSAGEIAPLCRALGLPLTDYAAREEFAVRNAALTADGAVRIMLEQSPRSLEGARVLVCGFGRIGKMLALRLPALGARVFVAARSAADREWARALGCEAFSPEEFGARGGWDFVLNTVPARIFGAERLRPLMGARLYELASAPGGFDTDAARELGLAVTPAPGLPGRFFPEAAGEIVCDTILNIMEEEK